MPLQQYASWNKELREPNYYNVIVDWHLYQFQFPKYTTNEHVAAARAWEQTIEEYDSIHPIIVGTYAVHPGNYSSSKIFYGHMTDLIYWIQAFLSSSHPSDNNYSHNNIY